MASLTQPSKARRFIYRARAIRSVALTLCFAILLSACATNPLRSLTELASLRAKLINEFHEQNINVTLHDTTLWIAFINSPLNNSPTERAARAQQTAIFVKNHYQSSNPVREVWVFFMFEETRFVVFHYYRTIASFGFNRNGDALVFGPPDPKYIRESNDPRHAEVRYSRANDETDIQVTRVQLEGNLDRGLALVPHFTVPGNALASGWKATSPGLVGLEFASYSDAKIYSESTVLAITSDGRMVYSGVARLLSSSSDNGTTTEFLSQRITYDQFLQMARAGNVRIKLGAKSYQLSSDQLEGLRDMVRYAEGVTAARE